MRVSNSSATFLDNFFCDIALLPVHYSVIRTNLSDHFMIQLKLNINTTTYTINKRIFSFANRKKFSIKLRSVN